MAYTLKEAAPHLGLTRTKLIALMRGKGLLGLSVALLHDLDTVYVQVLEVHVESGECGTYSHRQRGAISGVTYGGPTSRRAKLKE